MQEDEIRMQGFGAYGYVIPKQVVIIELGFDPLGQAVLSPGHARGAAAVGGDESSYGLKPFDCPQYALGRRFRW